MMPDVSRQLRPSPVLAGIIGALVALTSCDVVSSNLSTTADWPGPVAGVLIGYAVYRAISAIPLPSALRDFARVEKPRTRGGFPWRAAMIAWLVCILAGLAAAVDFTLTDILTHTVDEVPLGDLGLGVGFLFGIPVALGVLVLGYRRRELLPSDSDQESAAQDPLSPPTSRQPRRALSLELAAGVGALVGFYTCYLTLPFLSMWYAPPLGIVVALLVFTLTMMARAEEEPVASPVLGVTSDPTLDYRPAIASGGLPWAAAGLAWIACAVLGGLYAYGIRELAPGHDLRSFAADGLFGGALLGVPVALGILYLGRRKRA